MELVQADMAEFEFPPGVDRVISTFALTLSPRYEEVIRRVRWSLGPGGRFVLLDLKAPRNAGAGLIRFAARMAKPFAVTPDLADRHPWEVMEREFGRVEMEELYFGFSYIATAAVAPP